MSSNNEAHEYDCNLLSRLRHGDELAAREVVSRLTDRVERMVFRLTGWHAETQDLVQDVFLALQRSSETFRGQCSLETWATSITIRCCRKWQRHRSRAQDSLAGSQFEPQDNSSSEENHVTELREEVQAAMRQLRQDYREVVVLRYMEEYTIDQIAQLLDLRKNTVEVRLLRARRDLGRIISLRSAESRRKK